MKVAVIGCGNIAKVHVYALQKLEVVQIVGFADIHLDKAKAFSEQYTEGKGEAYADYVQMLETMKPDVVHICTPHYLHVPMAIEALRRNISVFMEKPPAISRAEFEELRKVEAQSEGRVGFCFQNRYNATTLKMDQMVREHPLGDVIGARGFVTWKREADYYADEWHGKRDLEGGGVLMNQSIHTLDLLLRYLGEPTGVAASMQNHHLDGIIEVEDTIEAWMEFAGGKRATFYATTAYAQDAPIILEVGFEKGRATIIGSAIQVCSNDGEVKLIDCRQSTNGIGKEYWGMGHEVCIQDYYRCLANGQRYENDIQGVANTLYTTMKIYEDARREREEA